MSDVGIGAVLRDARTEQQRGLEEAAAATSMRVAQLQAIEEDRFEIFGGDVYAKGFLKSYAKWLGLDPEPLLDTYRRYVQHDRMDPLALTAGPVTAKPPSEVPAWLLRVVAAAGVIALGVGLVQLVDSQVPAPADENLPPVVAPAPATPTPTATEGTSDDEEPEPEPEPAPIEGVQLTLAFEDRSWISVTVDGQNRQEGLFEPGDVLDLRGDEEVVVRIGNAGGVRALFNGTDAGPLGAPGTVLELRFTPHGFSEV